MRLEKTRLEWVLHRALLDPLIVCPPTKDKNQSTNLLNLNIKNCAIIVYYMRMKIKHSGFSLTNFGPPDDSATGGFATSEKILISIFS